MGHYWATQQPNGHQLCSLIMMVLNIEATHKLVTCCHVMQCYFTGVGIGSSGFTTYFAWVPAGKDLNQMSLYQFLESLFVTVPTTGGLS